MGEGQDPVHIRPTAAKEQNSLLDDSFFQISRETPEGLSSIPEKTLENFSYTRDNLDDILYVFKFISNESYFFDIACNEATDFVELSIQDQEKITRIANLFYGVLTTSPEIFDISPININEGGHLIAYINERLNRLDIMCKSERTNESLINSLLEQAQTKINNYPESLRSFANVFIEIDSDGVVNINFFANENQQIYYQYAPGYLRKFEEEFIMHFQKQFPDEKIKINF